MRRGKPVIKLSMPGGGFNRGGGCREVKTRQESGWIVKAETTGVVDGLHRECDTKDLKIIPGIQSEELKEWSCHQQRGETLE